jgi:hypothetical protein
MRMASIAIYGEIQGIDRSSNMHAMITKSCIRASMPACWMRQYRVQDTRVAIRRRVCEGGLTPSSCRTANLCERTHPRSEVTSFSWIEELQTGLPDFTIATRWRIAGCRLHVEELRNNTHGCDDGLQLREPGILDKYHESRIEVNSNFDKT